MIIQNPEQLVADAAAAFAAVLDINSLEQCKAKFLGKTGVITEALKSLGTLPKEERKTQGEQINLCKVKVEELLQSRRNALKMQELNERLAAEEIDITLPGRGRHPGGAHPITLTQRRIEGLFASIGFEIADGPEIETDFYNFTALNTPADHPARSMHDTFYLLDEQGAVAEDILLRTHTSPIQARYMQRHVARYRDAAQMPEIRIIAPGRVYRVDSDATHSPMFHQLEGLWVGDSISFADLKGVLVDFLHNFFEDAELNIRFRPSFFPFTEPSAEIDIAFKQGAAQGKWLEVLGCGMVHPNVLRMAGIDPERYSGFAFGIGIDRMTMLRYSIADLRLLFDGDLRFLRQFAN